MARTASLSRLSALAVKQYIKEAAATAPLHDGGGLYLRKREAGAYWYLRLTDPLSGAQQWHRLFGDSPDGAYPHKSLADARTRAAEMWAQRERGIDPRAEAQRVKVERAAAIEAQKLAATRQLTVHQLFERWASIALKPQLLANGKRIGRKDGGDEVRWRFDLHVFPRIGNMPAELVARRDVAYLLDALRATGKMRTANLLLQELRQMFAFALKREIVERNPTDTITKADAGGASVERNRVLSTDEVKALANALPASNLNARTSAGVLAILATGCRVGELMGATWAGSVQPRSELQEVATDKKIDVKFGVIDLKEKTWHLPDTKNQRSHTIHLSDFAFEQFARLSVLRESDSEGRPCAWVFPGRAGDRPITAASFGKQLADRQRNGRKKIKTRTQTDALTLPGGRWTAHDLRRTAATLMAQLGISGDVIDECLNHAIEGTVRRIYIRDRREQDQARAFDALGVHLFKLINGEDARSNVVPIAA